MDGLIIFLHVATLFITAGVIFYSDHKALAYFRGKEPMLSLTFVRWSHRLVWVGLLGMIGTGTLLVLPAWESYLQQPSYFIKMGFVGVLIFNSFVIGSLTKVATQRPFAQLTTKEQQVLLASGMLSAVGWIGAVVTAVWFL